MPDDGFAIFHTFVFVEKFLCTRKGHLVNIFFHFFAGEADAFIGDRDGFICFVHLHFNGEVAQFATYFTHRGKFFQFLSGINGIRDELTEKYFVIAVKKFFNDGKYVFCLNRNGAFFYTHDNWFMGRHFQTICHRVFAAKLSLEPAPKGGIAMKFSIFTGVREPVMNQQKKGKTAKSDIIREIDQILHTSWDLVSKRNTEIGRLSEKAQHLAQSINNKNYMGLAKMEQALFECLVNNNYYLSIKMCDEAYSMLRGRFREKYAPYYHLNIGRNYHFMGDHEQSQKHYFKVVNLLEADSETDYYGKRWLAHAYYNIFILFNSQGAEFLFEEYLNKALDVYQNIDDKGGIANCYNSYAVYYYKRKEYEKALSNLLKAYKLVEKEGALPYQSIYSANLALIYTRLNDFDNAEIYFQKAKEIDVSLQSPYHTGHTYYQMGEALSSMGKYDEAIKNFKIAEQLFGEVDAKRLLANVLELTSEAYALKQDFENAFQYKNKYARLQNEIFNDEKTFALVKARTEFELEKKEKEAQLLRQKNLQIEKYAHQLEISNTELKQFAHVASHDLREPLRMVSSYVTLLKRSFNGQITNEQTEFMQFILHGTQTMHLLIGDLLALSSIHFENHKTNVDLNAIMQTVVTNLASELNARNAVVNVPVLPTVKADNTHMLQLFQNLVSNGLKYNLSERPEITIAYTTTAKKYHFTISDNGIGIPAEFREKIFLIFQRLHPKDEFSGTGIGLAICKKIIDQMKGKIWVEANNNGGSDFKFSIPGRS